MNRTNQTFIANLKARMASLGLNVPALAKKTGLSASGLYEVFRGENWPQPDSLDRIAKALKTTAAALVSGPEDQLPAPTPEQVMTGLRDALNEPEKFAAITAVIAGETPKQTGRKAVPANRHLPDDLLATIASLDDDQFGALIRHLRIHLKHATAPLGSDDDGLDDCGDDTLKKAGNL